MSANLPQIAAALDAAADHIDKVGWFQGDLHDDYTNPLRPLTERRVCAIGALNVALYGTPRFPATVDRGALTAHDVADFLRSRHGGGELAEWNDAEGRTQAEVTELLRATAAELRGGAS